MELLDFIADVRAANNIAASLKDIEKMCYERAKEVAGAGNAAAIDDETVRQWIISYDEWKSKADERKLAKQKQAAEVRAKYDADKAARDAAAEAEKRAKALEKEKAEKEKEGQLSLFDL